MAAAIGFSWQLFLDVVHRMGFLKGRIEPGSICHWAAQTVQSDQRPPRRDGDARELAEERIRVLSTLGK